MSKVSDGQPKPTFFIEPLTVWGVVKCPVTVRL